MTTESNESNVAPQMDVSLAARAAAGAKHLDSIEPGWFNRIDLDKLDMGQGWRDREVDKGCVLCQLSPKLVEFNALEESMQEYNRGREPYKVNDSNEQELGFYLGGSEVWSLGYSQLNDCWRNEILARRKATEKHDA